MMRPRGDLVLVRKIKEENMTKGGIFLPGHVGNTFTHAEVLAKGKGHYLENGDRAVIDDLEVGDIVVCSNEKGLPLEVEGDRETMIVNQADIVAVDDVRKELSVIQEAD